MTQWLTERAHEEGLRPVDVILTSAQNHQAIKDLIEKLKNYVVGVMFTSWVLQTLVNQPLSMLLSKK